jgi:hypothetical protein
MQDWNNQQQSEWDSTSLMQTEIWWWKHKKDWHEEQSKNLVAWMKDQETSCAQARTSDPHVGAWNSAGSALAHVRETAHMLWLRERKILSGTEIKTQQPRTT